MHYYTAICVFAISWTSVFLIDYLARVYEWRAYIHFAERYGLSISPLQIRFFTSSRHRDDVFTSNHSSTVSYSSIISAFYSLGTIAAILSQLFITVYLSRLFFSDVSSWLFPTSATPSPSPTTGDLPLTSGDDVTAPHQPGLVPIVPGVNLPLHHIPLFMGVLVVCAIVHEAGHAWAARNRGVGVNGFGVFLLAIYPGAFTDIDTQSLDTAKTWAKMQIYCAGIWHNLLLALAAYLLYANAATLLVPGYMSGEGVMITDVSPSSGLYGAGGLHVGDVVVRIDDCEVRNGADWTSCVRRRRRSYDGKCVASEALRSAASDVIAMTDNELHCCPNATVSHLCFESNTLVPAHAKAANATSTARPPPLVELAGGVVLVARKEEMQQREIYACLPARETLSGQSCNKTESCDGEGMRCAYAALFNGTRLVALSVVGKERPVIFVGNFNELLYYVEHTDLSRRFTSLPLSMTSPTWLPSVVDLLAKYLLAFSLALGLLNALPCFALDGQHMTVTIVRAIFRHTQRRRRSAIIRFLLVYGTGILIGNIAIGFIRLYRQF